MKKTLSLLAITMVVMLCNCTKDQGFTYPIDPPNSGDEAIVLEARKFYEAALIKNVDAVANLPENHNMLPKGKIPIWEDARVEKIGDYTVIGAPMFIQKVSNDDTLIPYLLHDLLVCHNDISGEMTTFYRLKVFNLDQLQETKANTDNYLERRKGVNSLTMYVTTSGYVMGMLRKEGATLVESFFPSVITRGTEVNFSDGFLEYFDDLSCLNFQTIPTELIEILQSDLMRISNLYGPYLLTGSNWSDDTLNDFLSCYITLLSNTYIIEILSDMVMSEDNMFNQQELHLYYTPGESSSWFQPDIIHHIIQLNYLSGSDNGSFALFHESVHAIQYLYGGWYYLMNREVEAYIVEYKYYDGFLMPPQIALAAMIANEYFDGSCYPKPGKEIEARAACLDLADILSHMGYSGDYEEDMSWYVFFKYARLAMGGYTNV